MNYEKETLFNRKLVIGIMAVITCITLFIIYTSYTSFMLPQKYNYIMLNNDIVPVYQIKKGND